MAFLLKTQKSKFLILGTNIIHTLGNIRSEQQTISVGNLETRTQISELTGKIITIIIKLLG